MSHISNLLRDLVHISPGAVTYQFSAQNIVGGTILMTGDPVVKQTAGSISTPYVVSAATTSKSYWRGSGIYISHPVVDATPYRIKCHLTVEDQDAGLFIGYGPASPTGTDDTVTKVIPFPLITAGQDETAIFDEIVLIPGLQTSDPDFGKPIAVGIFTSGATAATARYHLSVQNLAKTAPQFAASMS